MVDPEITDGERIADLLEAELQGFEDPPFDDIATDRTGEAVASREPVYRVTYEGKELFEVVVQPDRAYLEFGDKQAEIRKAAEAVGLRVRPKATRPPATLVFVERGADVKRVIDVLRDSLLPQ